MRDLWVEKYRPTDTSDYVFKDQSQRQQVEGWIKSKSIPHLLFSGAPGVGKTTLAKILINKLEVNPYDVLEINASRENSVDDIRNRVTGFVQTMPFGDFKVVLLDEADYMSPHGQAALRGVMETYHATARFILTCNYPHKIIPALHSRCQGFHIDRIDPVEFTARVATILVHENVEFELDTLDSYVKSKYPDLRKCLNACQMNSQEGQLSLPAGNEGNSHDWKITVVDMFKTGKIREARALLCQSVRPDDMDDLISWAYQNLSIWSSIPEEQDCAITIIRDAAANVPLITDHEINVAAMMSELGRLKR